MVGVSVVGPCVVGPCVVGRLVGALVVRVVVGRLVAGTRVGAAVGASFVEDNWVGAFVGGSNRMNGALVDGTVVVGKRVEMAGALVVGWEVPTVGTRVDGEMDGDVVGFKVGA